MALHKVIDAGGEYLLPFAKKKLEQFKRAMVRAGQKTLSKVILVDDTTRIYLSSLDVGHGQFIDRVRITAGGGKLIIQSGQYEYSLISWDGKLNKRLTFTGSGFYNYAVHACVDGVALLANVLGNVYLLNTLSGDITAGPVSFGSYNQFAKYSPLVSPAVNYFVGIEDNTAVGSQNPIVIDMGLNVISTGPVVASEQASVYAEFQATGVDGVVYDDIGNMVSTGNQGINVYNVLAGTASVFEWPSPPAVLSLLSDAGGPTCVNRSQIVRVLDYGDSTFEISDYLGSAIATIVLFGAPAACTWLGLACDTDNLLAVAKNLSTGLIVAKRYDLSGLDAAGNHTFAETDVSSNFIADFVASELAVYMPKSRMSALKPMY